MNGNKMTEDDKSDRAFLCPKRFILLDSLLSLDFEKKHLSLVVSSKKLKKLPLL